MTIRIHPRFQEEKKYILHVLFEVYLGLPARVETDPQVRGYEVQIGSKRLLINDAFFQGIPLGEDYFSLKNIPNETSDWQPPLGGSPKIRVLYGSPTLQRQGDTLRCGADIFAGAFFMLSRWEEYAIKDRDKHQRFTAALSLAGKNDFLHRPVVDEYVEFLWGMLEECGITLPRKKRVFQEYPTHDVDHPRKWWGKPDVWKSMAAKIVKSRRPKAAAKDWRDYKAGEDPFDTFASLMDTAEAKGVPAHFFFMSGGYSEHDNFYKIDHPLVLQLLQNIHDRGHRIGFHPSYHAHTDGRQYAKELKKLQSTSPQPITTGRQHFLRFEVPYTWRIWASQGMDWDSTLGYADAAGFRCGTCHAFPVFDFLEKKQLPLLERPLIAMDVTFLHYQGLSPNEALAKMAKLRRTVEQYQGDWVWLWHNSTEGIAEAFG